MGSHLCADSAAEGNRVGRAAPTETLLTPGTDWTFPCHEEWHLYPLWASPICTPKDTCFHPQSALATAHSVMNISHVYFILSFVPKQGSNHD